MLNKNRVLESIRELPEEFSANELFDRIILLQKIQKAEQEKREGRGLSTEEAKQRLKKWLR